jgi:hypothetical protein
MASLSLMSKQHNGVSHSVAFLLGALLPTLLLFFLASDRLGEKLASISNLGNGSANQQMSHANISGDGTAGEKVRLN